MINGLQERIDYQGDLRELLTKVCDEYQIGSYISHLAIDMGYEDLNLIVETSHHKFFIKIFAKFRDKANCERYIEIIKAARSVGVQQPEIYGDLYETTLGNTEVRLCVMQYIDGKMLFESSYKLTGKDALFIVEEAVKINKIPLKPYFIYDSWAIVNFLKVWEERKQYLPKEDQVLISPLVEPFQKLSIQLLPHCFIHGDLIKTNIMRDKNENLYILDFSVANYYPRIQEIAVLLCDVFFDKQNLDLYDKLYNQTINHYHKFIPLENIEIQTLPLFAQLAHAMHLLCATYEKKVNNNQTKENEYFLNLGRKGLQFTSQFFNFNSINN